MIKEIRILLSLSILAVLSACGSTEKAPYQGVKLGKPYVVSGRIYKPSYNPNYDEIGIASWYGPGFHGERTASGERYNQNDLTAAHKTLPLPSIVRVTNLNNGRSAIIRINDRGPFVGNRIIDLSRAAASKLGVIKTGTAKVRVQFLDQETREYVSNLPNGPASLRKLDMLAESGKSGTYNHNTIEVSEITTPAQDDEPLPFVAPSYAQPQATAYKAEARVSEPVEIQPAAYVTNEPLPWNEKKAAAVEEKAGNMVLHKHENTGGHDYFVQAGTFGIKGNADRMLEAMKELASATIVETPVKNKKFYRVLAGPYHTRSDAESVRSKLDTVGISGAKIIRN